MEVRATLQEATTWAPSGHDVFSCQLAVSTPPSPTTQVDLVPPVVQRLLLRRGVEVSASGELLGSSLSGLQVVSGPELPSLVVYGPRGLVVAISRRTGCLHSLSLGGAERLAGEVAPTLFR